MNFVDLIEAQVELFKLPCHIIEVLDCFQLVAAQVKATQVSQLTKDHVGAVNNSQSHRNKLEVGDVRVIAGHHVLENKFVVDDNFSFHCLINDLQWALCTKALQGLGPKLLILRDGLKRSCELGLVTGGDA